MEFKKRETAIKVVDLALSGKISIEQLILKLPAEPWLACSDVELRSWEEGYEVVIWSGRSDEMDDSVLFTGDKREAIYRFIAEIKKGRG